MSADMSKEMIALLPRLRRQAISLAGSRHCADDLVQGTCERALSAAETWTPGTRLDAWMFRILRNLWIDMHRRRRLERLAGDVAEQDFISTDGEREIEARLMLNRVRSAISSLPPENREVLILVCIEDMSYRAVAEQLGVPIGTVMSRLSRARMRLAEMTGMEPFTCRWHGQTDRSRRAVAGGGLRIAA